MNLEEGTTINSELLELIFQPEKYNSKLILGNLTLKTDKNINLFHRIMFRILLGVKVERIKDGKKTI